MYFHPLHIANTDASGFPMQFRRGLDTCSSENGGCWKGTAEVASAAVALAALTPSEAWAKGGQWGPLEGKASSPSAVFKDSLRFGRGVIFWLDLVFTRSPGSQELDQLIRNILRLGSSHRHVHVFLHHAVHRLPGLAVASNPHPWRGHQQPPKAAAQGGCGRLRRSSGASTPADPWGFQVKRSKHK